MTKEEMLEDAQAVFDLYKQHIDPNCLREFMLNKVLWNFWQKPENQDHMEPLSGCGSEKDPFYRMARHYYRMKFRRARSDERRRYWQDMLND